MSYWLHPEAEAELGQAAVYYAEHASRAVAEAFLAEFERVRDLVVENQTRGPHADYGLRVYHFARTRPEHRRRRRLSPSAARVLQFFG